MTSLTSRFRVIDAHVHAFPPRVFEAVWRWFDRYGWPIRYQLQADAGLALLFAGGVARAVVLHYAHVAGMARSLNHFAAGLGRDPRVIPCATVLPGEPGARAILDEALGPLGCRGVKIHCHVQCVAPDDPRLDDVYDAAAAHGVPVVIHAGDGPASPHYACDVVALCTPGGLARALRRHPRTRVVVPHLGATRVEEIAALLGDYPNLYLDTTMTLARYVMALGGAAADPAETEAWHARAAAVVRAHPDRILYGTDFPNVPYEWHRELDQIEALGLDDAALAALLGGNAEALYTPRP